MKRRVTKSLSICLILILAILAVGAFSGLKRGLIKSVLSLAGLIIGVVLAGRLYTQVAELLPFIQQEKIIIYSDSKKVILLY